MSRTTCGTLFLARHGESTFNRDNKFTGWIDAPLTNKGRKEAKTLANKIKGYIIQKAYTSKLSRAIESLQIVLTEINRIDIPVIQSEALNERHYGTLQGLNKKEIENYFGSKQVRLWRKSYDVAPPAGESLADTAHRVLPFFYSTIMKDISYGINVLVLAHGNSLRAIVKELEQLSNSQIANLSIATGEVRKYEFDTNLLCKTFTVL